MPYVGPGACILYSTCTSHVFKIGLSVRNDFELVEGKCNFLLKKCGRASQSVKSRLYSMHSLSVSELLEYRRD